MRVEAMTRLTWFLSNLTRMDSLVLLVFTAIVGTSSNKLIFSVIGLKMLLTFLHFIRTPLTYNGWRSALLFLFHLRLLTMVLL